MAKKLLRYIAFTSMQIVLVISLNSWSPIYAESYEECSKICIDPGLCGERIRIWCYNQFKVNAYAGSNRECPSEKGTEFYACVEICNDHAIKRADQAFCGRYAPPA